MLSFSSHPQFIYHIYPLGALNAEKTNRNISVTTRIVDLIEWIPHWKALGVDTILLGPVFTSETHGYDTTNPLILDPRLGTNDDLYRLVSTLKQENFKVLLDGVFNHTGRSFPIFQELLNSGGHSEKSSWYKNIRTGHPGYQGSSFSYQGWNGHGALPELNLRNPEVIQYLLETVGNWIHWFHIDGIRLDAADVLDFEFMKALSKYCKDIKSDFWLLGEVIHGEYNRWVDDAALDSVTNYELYKSLWSSLKDKNFFELTWTLNRHFGPHGLCKNFLPLTFLDNHDVSRIASVLKDPELLTIAWDLSFLVPGIPSLYYGSEWDWQAEKGSGEDWNLRPACRPGDLINAPSRVRQISSLADLRKNHPALLLGNYTALANTNTQLAFLRTGPEETLLIVVNIDEKTQLWAPGGIKELPTQIWGPSIHLDQTQGTIRFTLPAKSLGVFRI